MIVSFDENVQERDCTVLFELKGKFDISVTVIEVGQKLGCCVFIVEQGEGVVNESIVTLTRPGLVLIHVLKDRTQQESAKTNGEGIAERAWRRGLSPPLPSSPTPRQ